MSVRTGDLDRLVLGRDMARTLGIRSLVRAEVAVYALRRGSFSSLLPVDGYSVRRLDVGGLFFLDLESENEYALTSCVQPRNFSIVRDAYRRSRCA